MPKYKGPKWYAVLIGRDGPQIYTDWDSCNAKVSRYPGAVFKSFMSRQEAEDYIGSHKSQTLNQSYFQPHGSTYVSKRRSPKRETSYAAAGPSTSKGPSASDTPEVVLSPEQREVLDHVQAGQNVFFTGSAGTGKSVLLREIISWAKRTHGAIAITASTGIASVNIGGTTLHSWAGCGIGNETTQKIVGKICGQKSMRPVLDRWRQVETLIIDEISMLDGTLFDKLEEMARSLRRKPDEPFGGIQLVLCGDFCQLPPVGGRDAKGKEIPATFAFEARSWKECVPSIMRLTRVFRQQDQVFADMLNEMRFARMSYKTIEAFKKLSRPVVYSDGIEPSELYAMRFEVENANNGRLANLPGESFVFNAEDIPGRDVEGRRPSYDKVKSLLSRLLVPESVTLKVGAQVMLIKNLQQGSLVNGSVGTIVSFMNVEEAHSARKLVAVMDPPGKGTRDAPIIVDDLKGSRQQPINIDSEDEDDGIKFGDDFIPLPDDDTSFMAALPHLDGAAKCMRWPLVRFVGGAERLIIPADFTVNNADGDVEAKRIQVPLILAWALSVHKSQGQTLQRVKVDLKRTFATGQAYVALSRATQLDQLQVLNFDATKVTVDVRVVEWYERNLPSPPVPDYDPYDNFEDEMDNEDAMEAYYTM